MPDAIEAEGQVQQKNEKQESATYGKVSKLPLSKLLFQYGVYQRQIDCCSKREPQPFAKMGVESAGE